MQKIFFMFALCGLLFTSCKKPADPDSHAGHSHDTELQLTAYNESFELFAEAEPLSVGDSSHISVHLTQLKNFKPLENEEVTLTLTVGDKKTTYTPENSDSKGIYLFELQPEISGDAMILVEIRTPEGNSTITVSGVKIYNDEHEAAHAVEDKPEENHGKSAIAFGKEQSWKIDFETNKPQYEPFGEVIRTTAQIVSDQTDETIIPARTSGIVVFAGNAVVEGRSISSGQELFSISGAGMAENNLNVRLTEAQSNYRKAEADYLRSQELVKEKIVSDKEFLQVKSEYETTKAVYDNLYRNFTEKGQRVASTASGFVKQLFVANGQYVEAGQPLLSVSKNKSLLLKADLQQRYASVLPYIVSANIWVMDTPVVYSLEELNGKVLSFGRALNNDNYLIPISFQIDNKAGFIPGGFVELYIKTKSEKPVLSLPKDALVEDQGIYFIFVQLTPESFEKRQVTVGANDGIRAEIKSGLKPDERVVTKGAVSVKLAESSGTLDPHAGHVH